MEISVFSRDTVVHAVVQFFAKLSIAILLRNSIVSREMREETIIGKVINDINDIYRTALYFRGPKLSHLQRAKQFHEIIFTICVMALAHFL